MFLRTTGQPDRADHGGARHRVQDLSALDSAQDTHGGYAG